MTLTIGMWGNCYIISIIKDLLDHNFFSTDPFFLLSLVLQVSREPVL